MLDAVVGGRWPVLRDPFRFNSQLANYHPCIDALDDVRANTYTHHSTHVRCRWMIGQWPGA